MSEATKMEKAYLKADASFYSQVTTTEYTTLPYGYASYSVTYPPNGHGTVVISIGEVSTSISWTTFITSTLSSGTVGYTSIATDPVHPVSPFPALKVILDLDAP